MKEETKKVKCQCGQSKDPNGYCDGSHKKKKHLFDMNSLPFPYLQYIYIINIYFYYNILIILIYHIYNTLNIKYYNIFVKNIWQFVNKFVILSCY